jgi:antitoxin component YwqK of YwqJK toxin-antitoxin module
MGALLEILSKPFAPLIKAVLAVVEWVKKLPELLKKSKETVEEKVLAPERSLSQYVKIGRRYFSKRLLIAVCLLVVGGSLYLYFRPPALLAGWLGWPRTLVEGSKQAMAYQGLGKLITGEGDLHYVGQVVKGVYEGKGKLYNDREVLIYDGEFKKGLPNGTGTQYNGQGQLVYQGEFKDGKFSGKGQAFHGSGKMRYDGEFQNGAMQGAGTKYYVTGQVQYTGQFVNDAYSGKGTLYDANGKVQYDGLFLDGKYEGEGKLYSSTGKLLYAGAFAAGEYSGAGKLFAESGKSIYDGAFLNGLYSGAGTEFYDDGTLKFKGEFAAGKYQGEGKLFAATGKPSYAGMFAGGKFEGEGQKFDADGVQVYKGQFKGGLEDGLGERFDKKGTTVHKGYFQRGRIYYPGFLGLDPKAVEALLDKPTDTTISASDAKKLEMLYGKYKMTFQLELTQDEKDSRVTAVEVWNESGLLDIDAIVKGKEIAVPGAEDEPSKSNDKGEDADAKPTLYRKDGNVTVYKVGDALYYCYYNGEKLLRAMVAPYKKG